MNKLLFNDRFVLMFSVFVALVLWIQVTSGGAREVQRTFTGIPLGWREIPEGLAVLEMEPSQVDVTLRGDRELMRDLTRDDFVATVSLARAEQGSVSYFVTVSVPRGVQLVQVTPQTVTVDIEESIEEVFSVSVDLRGDPAVDLADPSADPERVVVEGPSSRVESVSRVVAAVTVDGLERELREQVVCSPVDIHGETVRGVFVTPRQIDIVVPLEATRASRDLVVRPTVFGNLEGNLVVREITADPDIATVTGPESEVEELEYLVTTPVDLSEIDVDDLIDKWREEMGVEDVEDGDESGEADATTEEESAESEPTEPAPGDFLFYEVDASVALPEDVDSREIHLEPEEVLLELKLQVIEPE
ncbi:MAG: YbbR-like domain-containing protein [Clostridia bacterium]